MLSQLQNLTQEADGRYATDAELMFLQNYLKTARLRFSAYQKLQAAETKIIQQTKVKLLTLDASLLQNGKVDLTAKWQRDMVRGLRYCAQALLIDDQETLKESFLVWFQTIMRAYKAERSCNATYVILQDVVKDYLTADEAALLCPILELARSTLGQ